MRAYTYVPLILSICVTAGYGQTGGTLRGVVRLQANGEPLHHAKVSIVQLGRSAETGDDGSYQIDRIPPGAYDLTVQAEALSAERQRVQIVDGQTTTADFQLRLSPIREQVTVTASGREQSAFEAFQSVASLDSLQLVEKSSTSIGEVLDEQPGVAKRSFGPGNSRPVIRGFDGDRVLILQDGIRTGTLSSQSGDHGETIDASTLERLEVVKGPATLLYGSNALGGVVHAITRHHQFHEHPHGGLRGYVNGMGGSANAYGGGSAGFEYGQGPWLIWGSGGGQRTGDYHTPIGVVENSETRIRNAAAGFGLYGDKRFFSMGYRYEDGRYGIPTAPESEEVVNLTLSRHNVRFTTGFRNLGSFIDTFNLSADYSDYQHKELEGEEVGTIFDNRQFEYRGVFDQRKRGRLSGSFGFSGSHRDYQAIGEESLTPPVKHNSIAGFALEEIDFERVRLQFGGRVENNRYDPEGLLSRSFTGFSGAAGVHVPLWKGGAFVVNYTHSFRAPALEELYNHGPHPGNNAFEIGNPDLHRERADGIDLSLRHAASRLRAEANVYRYNMRNFVFLSPTGNIEDGLREAEYSQADARFIGAEASLDTALHPQLWLRLGMDVVDAQLKASHTPLPRIPPLRGRIGLDAQVKGLSVKPEVVLANAQRQVYLTETETPGYTTFNVTASYTVARQHWLQVFSVTGFNLGDRLYRNHLSFIKDFAPEIGRGVRFTYTVRFF